MNHLKKKKAILALLIVALFATAGVLAALNGGFFYKGSEKQSPASKKHLDRNGSAINGTADTKTAEQVLADLQKNQINVTDKVSSHILFPSGRKGTEGSWTVENSKANHVIMQCEVFLNGKMIARSVPIKPDQHINTITLLENVPTGQYDVTAYINYYSLSANEYISKAGFQIKLTIQ